MTPPPQQIFLWPPPPSSKELAHLWVGIYFFLPWCNKYVTELYHQRLIFGGGAFFLHQVSSSCKENLVPFFFWRADSCLTDQGEVGPEVKSKLEVKKEWIIISLTQNKPRSDYEKRMESSHVESALILRQKRWKKKLMCRFFFFFFTLFSQGLFSLLREERRSLTFWYVSNRFKVRVKVCCNFSSVSWDFCCSTFLISVAYISLTDWNQWSVSKSSHWFKSRKMYAIPEKKNWQSFYA